MTVPPFYLALLGLRRTKVAAGRPLALTPNYALPPNGPGRSGVYSETNGTFASSIDPGLTHLTSAVTYDLGCADYAQANDAPLWCMWLAHGYSQDMGFIPQALMRRVADAGGVAISVNLRGRSDNSGTPDDSVRELFDATDAVNEAATRFPAFVDPGRKGSCGFSGGGGNVMATHTKMPGMWIVHGSFFFGPDYWENPTPGHSYGASGDNPAEVLARIGPRTDLNPYRARNSLYNIVQATRETPTKLLMWWDSADLIGLPNRDVVSTLRAAEVSRSKWFAGESNPQSVNRWLHGYPDASTNPALFLACNAVIRIMQQSSAPAVTTTSGVYPVGGYVIHGAGFEVWTAPLGTVDPKAHPNGGQYHSLDVTWDVLSRQFSVSRRSGDCAVSIRMGGTVVVKDVTEDGTPFDLS